MKKIIFLYALWISAYGYAQDAGKPYVLIITTGGTIASQTNAPLVAGHQLIKAVPELTQYAHVEVE